MSYCYIYANPLEPEAPLYVGKGQGDRAYEHRDKYAINYKLRKALSAMKRAGLEPTITLIDAPSNEAACAYEIFWIKVYGRQDLGTGSLCNLTDGGEGGGLNRVWSEESKAKISAANLGRIIPEDQKEKMRKPKSDETRQRMSDTRMGWIPSVDVRSKISQTLTGRPTGPRSEETKARMAEAARKRWANARDKCTSPNQEHTI